MLDQHSPPVTGSPVTGSDSRSEKPREEGFKRSRYLVCSDVVNDETDHPVRILFSTRTARAVMIQKPVWEALESGKFTGLPDDALMDLICMEALVPAAEDEFETVLAQNAVGLSEESTLSYTVQPGADCQLDCGYCGQEHAKKFMPADVQDDVIGHIERKLSQNKKYKSLSITWYGGEPLMALEQIRTLSPRLIALAKENGLAYMSDMVSNGLSLRPKIFRELASDFKIRQFQITLDGTQEFHDCRRIMKQKGKATFQRIFGNILDVCNSSTFDEHDCKIMIRCNIDRHNIEGVSGLIDLFIEHGLQKKIIMQFAPVVDWGMNGASDESVEKESFSRRETEWIVKLLRNGFRHNVIPKRRHGACMVINKDSEVFDAHGNIFPCWEMPYTKAYENDGYIIGNVGDDPSHHNPDVITRGWLETDIRNPEYGCRSCTFMPVCGGACPKSWLEGRPACPSYKFNIEDRLALWALRSVGDVDDVGPVC